MAEQVRRPALAALMPGLFHVCLVVAVLAMAAAFSMRGVSAQEGVVLELKDVKPDVPAGDFHSVTNGSIEMSSPNYSGQYTWNPPPERIDANGFTLTLKVANQVKAGNFYAEISARASGLQMTPEQPVIGVFSNAGESKSDSLTVKVVPTPGLTPGATVTMNVGASYYYGVNYTYVVVGGTGGGGGGGAGGGGGNQDDGKLVATIECPSSIVISQMPMLQCAIIFTSWQRNTSKPVDVSLPGATDFYGNHANGIQVSQIVGNEDIFNWDSPHRWPFSVFACPSQEHVGANCYRSVTVPGMQTVVVVVRQGDQVLQFPLTFNAVAGKSNTGPNACGFTLGGAIFDKWIATGADQGLLGCATTNELDAAVSPPGTIGRYADFVGGLIVWHGNGRLSGAAFEVHGCIASLYRSFGASASWLGFPTGDEADVPGGRRMDFEGGYIAWDAANSECGAYRDGATSFSFEPDIDRAGADFRDFEMMADRLELCRDSCAANSSCVAYTYVRPGLQGARPHCWLKSSVPEATANGCCVSGVRY